MAVLIRKTDTAEFVHASDSAFDGKIAGASVGDKGVWFAATGQPKDCDRFKVRAITADEDKRLELAQLPLLDESLVGDARVTAIKQLNAKYDELCRLACDIALIDSPAPIAELTSEWVQDISDLIRLVSAGPLAGRRSVLTAAALSAKTTPT